MFCASASHVGVARATDGPEPAGHTRLGRRAMNWFQRLYRSTRSDLSHWPPVRAQPALEGLETRLAPANVFVVPVNQPADSAHFHTLAEALVGAGSSGMVTIE